MAGRRLSVAPRGVPALIGPAVGKTDPIDVPRAGRLPGADPVGRIRAGLTRPTQHASE